MTQVEYWHNWHNGDGSGPRVGATSWHRKNFEVEARVQQARVRHVNQPQLAIFTTQFQHETTSMCNLYQPTNFRCVPTHQHLSSLTLLAAVIVSLPLTRQGLRCQPILSGAHFGPIASLSFQLYVYSHHDRMSWPTLPGHDRLMSTDVTDFLCWYLAERLVTIAWPLSISVSSSILLCLSCTMYIYIYSQYIPVISYSLCVEEWTRRRQKFLKTRRRSVADLSKSVKICQNS
ncbi:hypothetical protein B0H11DRAFT_2208975 [Mycena galericulata]|nr:hypothetical protein B0H11DRAFT_2208975 [Mycena galericulata]